MPLLDFWIQEQLLKEVGWRVLPDACRALQAETFFLAEPAPEVVQLANTKVAALGKWLQFFQASDLDSRYDRIIVVEDS